MQWFRRNLKVIVPVGVLAIGAAILAFGVFGVHTLFIDDTVDEAGPVFDSGANPAPLATEPDATEPAAGEPVATEPAITEPDAGEPVGIEAPASEATVTDPPAAPATTLPPAPQVITLAEGRFIPRDHPGSGTAVVLTDGSDQRFLRFEDFSTDNGPDLNVYLTTSDAAADEGTFDDEFVDLGNLKGNIGDQNYEIPADVDLERFDTVVVWCVRFSSAFTAADLTPAA